MDDPFWDVMAVVYGDGDPFSPERRADSAGRFAFEVDGETVGGLTVLDLPIAYGETTVRCAGVAGVGVLPHRRGGGVGAALMASLVRHLAQEGYAMTSLYPFRDPFYAKAGYASTGWRTRIEAAADRIPAYADELPCRMVGPEAWAEIVSCQTAFAHRYVGVPVRDGKLWRRVLGENRPLRTYLFGDPVEAWVVVAHRMEFWSTDRIPDMGWSTARGYRSALAFLRRLAINKTGLNWYEPPNAPFLAAHLDHGVTATLDRPVMFRLLGPLPGRAAGDTVLEIRDPLLPELNGRWRVAPDGWTRTRDEPTLSGPVGPITQAVLGMPRARDLVFQGLLEGDGEAAEQALPAADVYHPDFY